MIFQRIYQALGNQEELNLFSHEQQCDMILKDLKIFLQNIRKNNFIINTIFKVDHNFNVIFIQELSWTTIRSIPHSDNCEGASLLGVVNHPNLL